MNVLHSVLLTCNAQEYSNKFKSNGIDAFTLKLLCDEDLKTLGINDQKTRSKILQHVANLQIPAEKHIDLVIDHKYMELVLAQMSIQLTKHLAALSIAVNRKDTIVCNIKLTPAAVCLKNCVMSLEKQLDDFQEKVVLRQKRKSYFNYKNMIVSTTILVASAVIAYKIFKYQCK